MGSTAYYIRDTRKTNLHNIIINNNNNNNNNTILSSPWPLGANRKLIDGGKSNRNTLLDGNV